MRSPYGEEFRNFMDIWDRQRLLEEIEHKKNKIKALIDGGPLLLFLKHKENGDIFGADEPSRVIFARMRKPTEDEPPEWVDNANFMATNMCKLMNGEGDPATVFGKKDLKHLDVLEDKDKLIDMLLKAIKGGGGGTKKIMVIQHGHEPGGIQFGNDFQEL